MKNIFGLLVFTIGVVGCASAKLDLPRAKAVHKVALLSFEIVQQQPKDGLGFAKIGELKDGALGDSAEFKAMATSLFNEMQMQIHDKTRWQVISLREMTANPTYHEKAAQVMTGLRLVSSGIAGAELVTVPGVLDNRAFRKMTYAEKKGFAQALGADAFAEVVIFQNITQGYSFGNLTGNAAFSFVSRANLMVYDMKSEEPLWRIQNVDGDNSENSDALGKDTPKTKKLAQIGLHSGKSAIAKLTEKYKLQ